MEHVYSHYKKKKFLLFYLNTVRVFKRLFVPTLVDRWRKSINEEKRRVLDEKIQLAKKSIF